MKTVSEEMVKQAGALLKREHEERMRLEKVAQDNVQERRAIAIAFREVELGMTPPYSSHEEFQVKIASLLKEDLEVVEKALDRGYGTSTEIGVLDAGVEPSNKKDPLSRWVLDGDNSN